jgi:hypothetical protein
VARDVPRAARAAAPRPSLSAAAARLRPQQRAALALSGLEGLRYAEIAAVLGIGAEAVGAVLARARLRLHDELHGTALAAAAVRSPDCEDVIPLLAAAADGELGAADAGWADPHVESCPTCPRTRRAIGEAAATYAAWSPAIPPRGSGRRPWPSSACRRPAAAALAAGPVALAGGAGHASGAAAARGRAGGARSAPRLSAALIGGGLLAAASAALALTVSGSPRQREALSGEVRLPDVAKSLRVPPAPAEHRARAQRRAPRRASATRHPHRVVFVAVRAVQPAPSASLPGGTRGATGSAPRRPHSRPKPRPPAAPAPAPAPASPAPATPVPVAPAPVTADAPRRRFARHELPPPRTPRPRPRRRSPPPPLPRRRRRGPRRRSPPPPPRRRRRRRPRRRRRRSRRPSRPRATTTAGTVRAAMRTTAPARWPTATTAAAGTRVARRAQPTPHGPRRSSLAVSGHHGAPTRHDARVTDAGLRPLTETSTGWSARKVVRALGLRDHDAGRPRVVAAMIASADGRVAVEGRSVGLGHPADRALLRELRTAVDAILVGTGTLRAERYANLLDDDQRAHRAAAGLSPSRSSPRSRGAWTCRATSRCWPSRPRACRSTRRPTARSRARGHGSRCSASSPGS